MTINTHGFESKDLQAYRGLAYDHLNKVPLTEDFSLINAALAALTTHNPLDSELSPSLQYRVEKLQDIMDEPDVYGGVAEERVEDFKAVIMDCIQEKIKYFEGKQKELSTNAEKYAQEMTLIMHDQLERMSPDEHHEAEEKIKKEALQKAKEELASGQKEDQRLEAQRQANFEAKKATLIHRKPSTESLYDFIRNQRDEGKWGNNWKMESLVNQDSVIVHYLTQSNILSRKDLLSLTVHEFLNLGQAWLEPLYQAEKESSGQTILTLEKIQELSSAHPKFQTIQKIQNIDLNDFQDDAGGETGLYQLQGLIQPYDDDKDVALEAARKFSPSLVFFSDELKNDKDVVSEALKQNGLVLDLVSEELKNDPEIVLKAVEQNGLSLEYASDELKNNRSIVLRAIKQNGLALEHASDELKNNRMIALKAVQHNGLALEHASDEIKNNRIIVLEAIRQNHLALEYASYELKKDPEIVSVAIARNSLALSFASSKIKDNFTIVSKAVEQNGSALAYASENLRGNKALVLKAVKQNGLSLGYASKGLKDNRAVVLEAVRQNGLALKFASDELKKDKSLALQAIQQNPKAFSYISPNLKADPEIRQAAGLA